MRTASGADATTNSKSTSTWIARFYFRILRYESVQKFRTSNGVTVMPPNGGCSTRYQETGRAPVRIEQLRYSIQQSVDPPHEGVEARRIGFVWSPANVFDFTKKAADLVRNL